MQYSALHNRTWITLTVQKPCRNRAAMAYKTKKPWNLSISRHFLVRWKGLEPPAYWFVETKRHLSSISTIHEESSFSSMHRDFRVVNLLYSFALFALLCTCYPSLQCAENVQKCAEPKSALQDDLKLNGFPAGFLGHRQSKNSQFHPDNNLTSYTGFMAGFRTSEQTPFDIESEVHHE